MRSAPGLPCRRAWRFRPEPASLSPKTVSPRPIARRGGPFQANFSPVRRVRLRSLTVAGAAYRRNVRIRRERKLLRAVGWLSGCKRRFPTPLYRLHCLVGSTSIPSANFSFSHLDFTTTFARSGNTRPQTSPHSDELAELALPD